MFCSNCGQNIGEAYIRRLIREELRQLDPETAGKLTDQIAARLVRTQVPYTPPYETKIVPIPNYMTEGPQAQEGKKE